MKVDFSTQIRNTYGIPFQHNGKPLTLGVACSEALLARYDDEKNMSKLEKMKRYNLTKKIFGKKQMDVTAENITILQDLAAKFWNVLIAGQMIEMLEGNGETFPFIEEEEEVKGEEEKVDEGENIPEEKLEEQKEPENSEEKKEETQE